jgi:hypothetical protein
VSAFAAASIGILLTLSAEAFLWLLFRGKATGVMSTAKITSQHLSFRTARRMKLIALAHTLALCGIVGSLLFFLW